ncbi:MAG: phosphoribosylformylglycinamidine synthase subunit PurQ [Candidatus Kapaibacteriales bacterium]
MKFGVVIFPGSNCDYDVFYALSKNLNFEATFLWHKESNIPKEIGCIVLPGGFSYGDYLRCGAIARFSPIMKEVINFSNSGKLVIGICNGFQILTEAGLLPGALLKNSNLRFICKDVYIKTVNNKTPFTLLLEPFQILKIPIAHFEGNYFIENDKLKELQDNEQIVFQYCDQFGNVNSESNPNGSLLNIAGIVNKNRNVLGMMPHPERVCDPILRSGTDGKLIFSSIYHFITNQ